MPPELDDKADIIVGDIEEAFGLMQYAVIRDPDRVEYARRVMSEALQGVVDRARQSETIGGGIHV